MILTFLIYWMWFNDRIREKKSSMGGFGSNRDCSVTVFFLSSCLWNCFDWSAALLMWPLCCLKAFLPLLCLIMANGCELEGYSLICYNKNKSACRTTSTRVTAAAVQPINCLLSRYRRGEQNRWIPITLFCNNILALVWSDGLVLMTLYVQIFCSSALFQSNHIPRGGANIYLNSLVLTRVICTNPFKDRWNVCRFLGPWTLWSFCFDFLMKHERLQRCATSENVASSSCLSWDILWRDIVPFLVVSHFSGQLTGLSLAGLI